MKSGSERHAACPALPAVVLGPGLDLLFVLIEFVCLLLRESPPYRSAKQTAGFFYLLGSVLLTGRNLSPHLPRMLWGTLFCLSELMVGCLFSSPALVVSQTPAGFTLRCRMTLAAASPLTLHASLSNAKTNILRRTGCFPGHPDTKAMLSLRSDPVLCGS